MGTENSERRGRLIGWLIELSRIRNAFTLLLFSSLEYLLRLLCGFFRSQTRVKKANLVWNKGCF